MNLSNEKHQSRIKVVHKKLRRHITKRRVIIGGLITSTILLIIPIFTYMAFANDIADRDRLMNRDRTGIILKDKNGEILYNYGKLSGQADVPLDKISDNLEKAVIASEDQEFFKHEGYSIKGIVGALYANLLNKDPVKYGGSTITQQLVKNKLLGSSKNYFRKYQEVTMAMAIERKYTKAEIMEMYLNSVYFGEGAFGIQAASKTYFNKQASELTVAESSQLVGLLPAPSIYSPISGDAEIAKKEQGRVLRQMVESGFISSEQKDVAFQKKLKYAPKQNGHEHAQHFVMSVLDELREEYGEENITRAGYEVTTTLDLKWQKRAEKILQDRIRQIKKLGAENASLVAIDPKSGEIRVLIGSSNWHDKKFGKVNMAVSPRQPGSSFKPIYYTESLEKKLITPATVMKDEAKTYGDYEPQNFDFKFRGDIPIRNALAESLNIPSIEVIEKLGVDEAARTAQRLGISDVNEPDKYGLTLALGTAEVKVLDMVNAYAAFANQGEQYEATSVTSIKDKFGEQVYKYEKKGKKVMSPGATYLMSSILSDNNARAPTFGGSLTIPGRQVAVKTGTTDDSKDAWTIGFTPSISTGVWVGNNQHKPMTGLTGSISAGAIWRDSMNAFLEGTEPEEFKQPDSVTKSEVCNVKGKYEEYFLKGTEPKDACKVEEKKDDDEKKKEDDNKKRKEEERDEDNDNRDRDRNRGRGNDRGGGTSEPPRPDEEPPVEEESPTEEESTSSE